MHIVFAHDKPLPVAKYGGTERILFWLMKTLVRKGHQVTLIGHPNSKVEQHGIELIAGDSRSWPNSIPAKADIVNLFFSWDGELSKPHVCRIGGNGKPGEEFPINTIFVSQSHAQNHGAQCVVYNGLDLEEYPESLIENKREISDWNSFAFIAKAKWKVKNLNDCLRAVKSSHKELHIGGGRAWSLNRKIHSYGMVDQNEKFAIFAKTDALVWPILWPEPFGIAMIEAMAAGLPVIASRHGSSKEIINSNVGHICKDYQEFSEIIAKAPHNFNPQTVRNHVVANFNSEKMCDGYLECYEKVLSGQTLNTQKPRAKFTANAQVLLKF